MQPAIYTTLPGLRVTRHGEQEMELFIDHDALRAFKGFTRIFHKERYGEMDFQYYIGEGFQIWRSHYGMWEPLEVRSRGAVSMLELHIPLKGDAMNWWDGRKENTLRKHQFELEYIPFIESRTLFHAKQPCVTLDIHYDFNFLKLFADQFPILNEFLLRVEANQRAQLLNTAIRFLSPEMLHVALDILQYRGTKDFEALYFHEHVSTLLHLVLERTMNIKHEYSTKKYLDATVSIRELIERNPSTIYTAKSLSVHTGINVSLLHKVFREFNGTTLFDFSQGVRLDLALQLLQETSLYVLEVGQECGYYDPANFTTAFRNRFGFTPQH